MKGVCKDRVLLFLFGTVLLIVGCATPPLVVEEGIDRPALTNRIIHQGIEMRVPAGWSFLHGDPSVRVPFRFREPNGVTGELQLLDLPQNLRQTVFLDYFRLHVLSDVQSWRTQEIVTPEGGGLLWTQARTSSGRRDSFFVFDGSDSFALHLQIPEATELAPELVAEIVSTVQPRSPSISARMRDGDMLEFLSIDDGLVWFSDQPGGYLVVIRAGNQSTVGSVVEIDSTEFDRRLSQREHNTWSVLPGLIESGTYHVSFSESRHHTTAEILFERADRRFSISVRDESGFLKDSVERPRTLVEYSPLIQLVTVALRFPNTAVER